MDNEEPECGQVSQDELITDCDHHVNVKKLPELFDDESVDAYIAQLNDWD